MRTTIGSRSRQLLCQPLLRLGVVLALSVSVLLVWAQSRATDSQTGSAGVGRADQFTPVVVSPLAETTTPVLGTDGKYHVVYELTFTNARPGTATLKKIAILDTDTPTKTIATYEGGELLSRLRTLGNTAASSPEIEFNGMRLFLIHLAFASPAEVPRRLVHHVELLGASGAAPEPTPSPSSYTVTPFPLNTRLPVIGPPLAGKGWVAVNGCCEVDGAHRKTVLPVNGQLYIAQRYAIDWMRLDEAGRLVHGDPSDVHSYPCYGDDLLAVADGSVVSTLNTLDDQIPGTLPDPKTITVQNVDGNHVVIDLGNGFFAFYAHMQKGSVAVQPGDQVKRGQVLGKLGNSGNTSAPHLHFHIMDGPSVLGSDGLPYVIDQFQLAGRISKEQFAAAEGVEGNWSQGLFAEPSLRQKQFPLDLMVVDFLP